MGHIQTEVEVTEAGYRTGLSLASLTFITWVTAPFTRVTLELAQVVSPSNRPGVMVTGKYTSSVGESKGDAVEDPEECSRLASLTPQVQAFDGEEFIKELSLISLVVALVNVKTVSG